MIVGAHLEPEEPEEQALHLGVFKPKAGVREKLRETLHTVLEHEMAERGEHREEEEPSTIAPLSTVTISRNTRYGLADTFHVGIKMHDRNARALKTFLLWNYISKFAQQGNVYKSPLKDDN